MAKTMTTPRFDKPAAYKAVDREIERRMIDANGSGETMLASVWTLALIAVRAKQRQEAEAAN